jgi:hypothetical protein
MTALLGLAVIAVPAGLVGLFCAWLAFAFAFPTANGDFPTLGHSLLWVASIGAAFLIGSAVSFAALVLALSPIASKRGWFAETRDR